MIGYLRSFTGDDAEAQWAHGMAARIEAHVNDQAPIARFARAFGMPPERIVEAAILSKVKIVEG
jgi:predicted secreted protein